MKSLLFSNDQYLLNDISTVESYENVFATQHQKYSTKITFKDGRTKYLHFQYDITDIAESTCSVKEFNTHVLEAVKS